MGGCASYQQASGPLHITDNYFYNNKHRTTWTKRELPLTMAAVTNASEVPLPRKRLDSQSTRRFTALHSSSISTPTCWLTRVMLASLLREAACQQAQLHPPSSKDYNNSFIYMLYRKMFPQRGHLYQTTVIKRSWSNMHNLNSVKSRKDGNWKKPKTQSLPDWSIKYSPSLGDNICPTGGEQLLKCVGSSWLFQCQHILSGGKIDYPQRTNPPRNLVNANLVSHFLQKTLV